MQKRPIDYEQITKELMREIKESFQSSKTGKTYLKSLKVKTASPTKRSKMEYIELLEKNKETGELEISERKLKMLISNKKLPGETEQEFKNKILKNLNISFSQVDFSSGKVSSKTRSITGKEWEKLRIQQDKVDKTEQRSIGSIPGSIKNIEKQLGKSKADREREKINYDRNSLKKSIREAFVKGLNSDFDKLNRLVIRLINQLNDDEFKNLFYGRSDSFYLNIFSSDEDIIMSSYIELVKDLMKTPQGKKYIDNLSPNHPLYKYLKDLHNIDDLFNVYKDKSLKVRTTPVIFA